MNLQLTGKTAVITGASQGIGLAVTRALAREGVQVVLCARHAERVEAAAHAIHTEFGVAALGVAADVTAPTLSTGWCRRSMRASAAPIF